MSSAFCIKVMTEQISFLYVTVAGVLACEFIDEKFAKEKNEEEEEEEEEDEQEEEDNNNSNNKHNNKHNNSNKDD